MIRILTTLIAALAIVPVQAQSSSKELPKVVVGITIDQLRGDYLEHFMHEFGEGGFKRLLSQGLVYQNIKFDFPNLNEVSTLATIYTGANPTYHGIIDTKYFSSQKHQVEHIFADNNFIGNYTTERLSPLALKGTTITDELKIASRGSSDVFSFAPNAEQALITAGRGGNTAFWIDDYSGKWASTTYYKDFYWTVDQDNRRNDSFYLKVWGAQWTPLKTEKTYKAFPYTKTEAAFAHYMGTDKETYKLVKKTPLANENIREAAINLLDKSDIDTRIYPGFVSLNFYAGKYPKADDYGIELKDTYIRLDRDIEQILNKLDTKFGLQNVLVFVVSTGYFNSDIPSESNVVNIGEFHVERCEALLNMYLMAIYGQNEKWVEKYYDKQIYLNRELIKSKNLDLKEIRKVAAEFVSEFTGVHSVYTHDQIFWENPTEMLNYIKNGLSAELSGDLIVELESGFTIVGDEEAKKTKTVRNDMVACPVFFLGKDIKAEKIQRTIKATEIAPSVAYVMRIRAPSASKEYPLIELQSNK